MKVVNMADTKEVHLRALLYSASGMGKTTSILTLPLDRTLVLMAEPKRLPLIGQDVDLWDIEDYEDVRLAFAKARKGLESDEGLIVNGKKKDIIFVDSLTEINEKCKKQILAKDRPELLSKRKKKDVGGIYDELMGMEDWGLLGTRIDALVSAFCHLPCHLIVTALEHWVEDKATGEVKLLPALNGKLANTISRHFDFAFHLEVQKIEGADRRFFRTSHSMQVMAKGSPHLDDLEDPSWTKILTKIGNAGKSAKKKALSKKAAKDAAKTKGGENDGT